MENKRGDEVPHFELKIEEENEGRESILKILSCVRPNWEPAKISFKFLTDGKTNKLVLCTEENQEILVRIYGHKTDLLIDRKAEISNIKLLHKYNIAPTLYATFVNGLVYEFIPGNTLSADDVSTPKIYKLVAREMAKMHKIPPPQNEKKPIANIWAILQRFVDLIPEKFQDDNKQKHYASFNFPKSQLLAEIREFKELINEFEMPIVFCHNDLLLGNIIFNEEKNKVFFIDFEYAGFNYQPFDISNHFTEFSGVNEVDYSKCPSRELQLDWIRTYLEEYENCSEISDEKVEILYVKVNKFVLVTHLLWYSWSLIQAAYSHIDFDYIEYAGLRLNEYFKKKPELLNLKFPNTS